jgi:signal transduction histidine kinase
VGWWHHRRGAARVARAAHELRGSLGALRLGLDLALAQGGLSPERLAALDLQLTRAAAALEGLTGPARPACRAPVAVGQLLTETVTSLEPLATRRGSAVHLRQVPDAIVFGNRGSLAQAVGNLIANAIEHGGSSIEVAVGVGEAVVGVEVCDDGAGLAPHGRAGRLRRMARWPVTSRHGHGLSVAADVATAHGGRLLSAPGGRGARMVLELPRHHPARVASARAS